MGQGPTHIGRISVSSYKRRTKKGKIVSVRKYTQRRDLLDEILRSMAGRPKISAVHGDHDGAQVPQGRRMPRQGLPNINRKRVQRVHKSELRKLVRNNEREQKKVPRDVKRLEKAGYSPEKPKPEHPKVTEAKERLKAAGYKIKQAKQEKPKATTKKVAGEKKKSDVKATRRKVGAQTNKLRKVAGTPRTKKPVEEKQFDTVLMKHKGPESEFTPQHDQSHVTVPREFQKLRSQTSWVDAGSALKPPKKNRKHKRVKSSQIDPAVMPEGWNAEERDALKSKMRGDWTPDQLSALEAFYDRSPRAARSLRAVYGGVDLTGDRGDPDFATLGLYQRLEESNPRTVMVDPLAKERDWDDRIGDWFSLYDSDFSFEQATMMHEFGHHLFENSRLDVREAMVHGVAEMLGVDLDETYPVEDMVRQELIDITGDEHPDQESVDEVLLDVQARMFFEQNHEALEALSSGYGADNWHEFFAEMYAEYTTNPNPRPPARIIGETLEEIANGPRRERRDGDASGPGESVSEGESVRGGSDQGPGEVEETGLKSQVPPNTYEEQAIESLIDNSFEDVNFALRHGELLGPDDQSTVDDLIGVIKDSTLDREAVLYRGIGYGAGFGPENFDPGAEITDNGFAHYSTDLVTAEDFATGGVILKVSMPAGTHILSVNEALPAPYWAPEQEYALAPGSKVRVTSRKGNLLEGVLVHDGSADVAPPVRRGIVPVVESLKLDDMDIPEDSLDRSPAVTEDEYQLLAAEGRRKIELREALRSHPAGLDEHWEEIKARSWEAVQDPWGGVTIDAHDGTEAKQGQNRYALTVKRYGQETVSIPIGSSQEEFNTALTLAMLRFGNPDHGALWLEGAHLGVFRDDEAGRIDIDPVLVVDSLDDVRTIGAYTRAKGGAYSFADGLGYWPPHVEEEANGTAVPGPGRVVESGQESGGQGPQAEKEVVGVGGGPGSVPSGGLASKSPVQYEVGTQFQNPSTGLMLTRVEGGWLLKTPTNSISQRLADTEVGFTRGHPTITGGAFKNQTFSQYKRPGRKNWRNVPKPAGVEDRPPGWTPEGRAAISQRLDPTPANWSPDDLDLEEPSPYPEDEERLLSMDPPPVPSPEIQAQDLAVLQEFYDRCPTAADGLVSLIESKWLYMMNEDLFGGVKPERVRGAVTTTPSPFDNGENEITVAVDEQLMHEDPFDYQSGFFKLDKDDMLHQSHFAHYGKANNGHTYTLRQAAIFHEFGHVISVPLDEDTKDELLDLIAREAHFTEPNQRDWFEFQLFYNPTVPNDTPDQAEFREREGKRMFRFALNREKAAKRMSEYGATNWKEFVAECYAEYVTNPRARRIATVVGKFIEEKANAGHWKPYKPEPPEPEPEPERFPVLQNPDLLSPIQLDFIDTPEDKVWKRRLRDNYPEDSRYDILIVYNNADAYHRPVIVSENGVLATPRPDVIDSLQSNPEGTGDWVPIVNPRAPGTGDKDATTEQSGTRDGAGSGASGSGTSGGQVPAATGTAVRGGRSDEETLNELYKALGIPDEQPTNVGSFRGGLASRVSREPFPEGNIPPGVQNAIRPGDLIYAHPQGATIVVRAGRVTKYDKRGNVKSTTATADNLLRGHGQWQRVVNPKEGPTNPDVEKVVKSNPPYEEGVVVAPREPETKSLPAPKGEPARRPMKYQEAKVSDLPKYVNDDQYVLQQKIDGIRAQLVIEPGKKPWFRSSTGGQLQNPTATKVANKILATLGEMPEGGPTYAVDGEIVGGKWHVFDLVQDGQESQPYSERMAIAESWTGVLKDSGIDLVEPVPVAQTPEEKQHLIDVVYNNGGEGVMVKRRDGAYRYDKRVTDSVKVKFKSSADVVVMEKGRKGKDNVVIGLYENGKLIEVGSASLLGKQKQGKIEVGDVIEVQYLYAFPSSRALVQPTIIRKRPDATPEEANFDQLRFANKEVIDKRKAGLASRVPTGKNFLSVARENKDYLAHPKSRLPIINSLDALDAKQKQLVANGIDRSGLSEAILGRRLGKNFDPKDMDTIVNSVADHITEIVDGMDPELRDLAAHWYPAANSWVHKVSRQTGLPPEQMAAATAIMSANTGWDRNRQHAEAFAKNVLRMQQAGATDKEIADSINISIRVSAVRASEMVRSGNIDRYLKAGKTRSFNNNILDPEDDANVTVDVQMGKVFVDFGLNGDKVLNAMNSGPGIGGLRIILAEALRRDTPKGMPLSARQAQAWVEIQRRAIEHRGELSPKEAKRRLLAFYREAGYRLRRASKKSQVSEAYNEKRERQEAMK